MEKILLKCDKCCETDRREHFDPYTGHYHTEDFEYVCGLCGGGMREVKYYPEAGECDRTLNETLSVPTKIPSFRQIGRDIPYLANLRLNRRALLED